MQAAITVQVVNYDSGETVHSGWFVGFGQLSIRETINVFLDSWDGKCPMFTSCDPLCEQEHCWIIACNDDNIEHACYNFHLKGVTKATRARIFRYIILENS